MNVRKPPTLANWLLNRFGATRQNPPLAGDLLEEFRSGRSAAWFWRQTLVVIVKCATRRVRLCWRPLAGLGIGWTVQAGVALGLWWLHYAPQVSPTSFINPTFLLIALIAAAEISRRVSKVVRSRHPGTPVVGPYPAVVAGVYCHPSCLASAAG
jgi:hypothetical protein